MKRWYYSAFLLLCYVSLFLFWRFSPSRWGFAGIGLVVVAGLTIALLVSWRRGYFLNRVDFCLHVYVVFDLLLESLSFEGLLYFWPNALVQQFHNNNNFIGCTLILTVLVGGYRLYSIRKANSAIEMDPPESSVADVAQA